MKGSFLISKAMKVHVRCGALLVVMVALSAGSEDMRCSIKTVEQKFGDWKMIFRGTNGIGVPVVETYLTPGKASELDLTTPVGCVSIDGNASCDRHYRHSMIDSWSSLDIQQVKVELYNEGKPVGHVVFNGKGTTSTNWLSQGRVVSSSWTDIHSSRIAVFGFFGQRSSQVARRLMMHHSGGGKYCSNEEGWMVVVESRGSCSWENKYSDYPVFLYSPYTSFTDSFQKADVLAIYIHYHRQP